MSEGDTAATPAGDGDPGDEGEPRIEASAEALERLESDVDGRFAEPLVAETGMKPVDSSNDTPLEVADDLADAGYALIEAAGGSLISEEPDRETTPELEGLESREDGPVAELKVESDSVEAIDEPLEPAPPEVHVPESFEIGASAETSVAELPATVDGAPDQGEQAPAVMDLPPSFEIGAGTAVSPLAEAPVAFDEPPDSPADRGDEDIRPELVEPVQIAAPEHQLFSHGGIELHFESFGPDGAPAVIAFHEAGQDLRSWWPVIRALGDDYRLIGVDLPGHGRSPAIEPGTWTAQDIAEHGAALLEHLGVPVSAAAGYGLGARIAIELAAAHPELIAAVVVADLIPAEGGWSAFPPDPAEDLVARRGPKELGKRLGQQVHEEFYRRGMRARYDRMDRDGLLGALLALHEAPEERQLRCPVVVCIGDGDGALSESRALAQRLGQSRLLRFRDAQRPVVHARPEDFGEQVYRFLRAVEEGNEISGERTI